MAAAAATKPLRYFSSWFCPFAHRCTIALEHHGVPYDWDESLGWEKRQPTGEENFEVTDRADWWYHWKSPELLKANKYGMVPTLLEPDTGLVVHESIACIQFVDEYAREVLGSTKPAIMSGDPFARARARVAADRMAKEVCSNYYTVLVRTEDDQRKAGFGKICDGLLEFAGDAGVGGHQANGTGDGIFWGGAATPGLVDMTLFPHAHRLYALEHYRGPEFALPTTGENGLWERVHAWLDGMAALDFVAKTLPGRERYIKHVAKYAHGAARSKVGNAVKRGVSAHDYDDDVDDR